MGFLLFLGALLGLGFLDFVLFFELFVDLAFLGLLLLVVAGCELCVLSFLALSASAALRCVSICRGAGIASPLAVTKASDGILKKALNRSFMTMLLPAVCRLRR